MTRNIRNQSSDNSINRLMIKAVWMQYKEELTQGQIANRLGISRIKVNRLIQQAKAKGIVEITIKAPIPTYNELEEQLVKSFNLQEAIVVMDVEDTETQYQALAQGTADWLAANIAPKIDIGISLGRTLAHLPNAYFPSTEYYCNFVDIIGNISELNSHFDSYNVTARMAERFGGQALRLNAPTVVSSAKVLQSIKNEPYVNDVLNRARNAEIVLLSCGPVDKSMLLYMHNFISLEEMEDLKLHGAIGDVLSNFMDKDGNPVRTSLDNRIVALTLEEIQKIPKRVLIAAGDEKIPMMKVVLKKGIFNVLVTTLRSATQIFQNAE